MGELVVWGSLIGLIVVPLISIILLCISWSRFKETVPFTPEHSKKKFRLIVVAVFTGIVMAIYVTVMVIYGIKVFFAF